MPRKKRVAVEQGLGNVSQLLAEKGYEVVQLDPVSPSGVEMRNVEAVVITGSDENIFGASAPETDVPVIDATGLTAEEVWQQLQEVERVREK